MTIDNKQNDHDLETFRERVKDRLRAAECSQRELEDSAGFSTGYLSKLLNGERPLKASTIRVLATALEKLTGASSGSMQEQLVAGTYYEAVLMAGDDGPTDVLLASVVKQLDEQRARAGELEAAKAAAEARAVSAEEQVAALEAKLTAAEQRAADSEIKARHEGERAARSQAMVGQERHQRIEAEQSVARLRARVELPVPVSAQDHRYMRLLREQGVTDWMTYARLLEAQRNALLEEQQATRGKPGWGTAAAAFIVGVGAAMAAGSSES